MSAPCEPCRALGWIKRPGQDWAVPCPACLGTTVGPTCHRIATRIEENPTTVYRLRDMRVSGPTAERLAPARFEIPPRTRFVACKACMTMIAFVPTEAGKKMPVDVQGIPHWIACTGSAEFREKKKLEDRLAELRAEAAKR